MSLDQSPCRSCGAPVVWITTRSGRTMPCDPEIKSVLIGGPPTNRLVILINGDGATVRGYEALPGATGATAITGRVSHFATCPNWDPVQRGVK